MWSAGIIACALLAQSALTLSHSWQHHHSYHNRRHSPFIRNLKRDDGNETQYDYIVVGSGPGGGPLATNLAIAGYKVLLIDAGGDSGEGKTFHKQSTSTRADVNVMKATDELVPGLHFLSSEFVDTAWSFYTQHFSDGSQQARDSKMMYQLSNGSQYMGLYPPADATPQGILYPRAGTLGGCSRHNAMITIYAHDSDWTYISELTGDDSWAPDKMRKYFETIENNKYLPSSIVGHGYKGWLTTSVTYLGLVLRDMKFLNLVLSAVTASGGNILDKVFTTIGGLGSLLLLDLNAPGQTSVEGLYQVPISMKDGVRASPREFILDTANAVNQDGSRKYFLDIKLDTLVSKVVFDQSGSTPRAVGVEYLEGKDLYRAHGRSASASITGSGSVNATREVIIAGGAFNTPQILKLSGVGPAAELEPFGIPVVVDLPGVGTNMQDRYENSVISVTDEDYVLTKDCTFTLSSPDPCLEEWQSSDNQIGRGVYATNGGAIAKVMKSSVADGEPDIIILGAPGAFTGYFPGYSIKTLTDKRHWSWIILKAHSRNSAGTVTLTSTDPRDMPNITFHNFAEGRDEDLQALYEGFQWARDAFDAYVPLFGAFTEDWPGANFTAEADIKTWMHDEAWGHHASCTCPIGADDDPMAVLDSKFQVRGVQGLRVVDASAFPKIPGYFIAAPLYMMSQKASEYIISDAQAS